MEGCSEVSWWVEGEGKGDIHDGGDAMMVYGGVLKWVRVWKSNI